VHHINYEQPLNERIRNFLRIELLLRSARHNLDGESPFDSRATLDCIIGIMSVIGRIDIKNELIKELERHTSSLAKFRSYPDVDHGRLQDIHDQLESLLITLRDSQCQPGSHLRNNEMLSAVRNRSSIPGGASDFDLPGYHYWLQQPARRRNDDLRSWLADLDVIGEGVLLALQLIRSSTSSTRETASAGFFQKPLDASASSQLIRVALPIDLPLYPEISAGKHRFTIRFMQQDDMAARPVQTEEDVAFELLCCVL